MKGYYMAKDNLIQITVYRKATDIIETVKGPMSWDDRLEEMRRDMKRHGRICRIDKKRGEKALFADDITGHSMQRMKDCTAVNVRTL